MKEVQSKSWDWAAKREKKAFLALEDGSIYHGYSIGFTRDTMGEVVFNTGMTGYQEILSDPSYSGQLITLTYPEIGNTGINPADMESKGIFARGLIVHDYNIHSNWRAKEPLSSWLARSKVPAIGGIDTRALTIRLRDKGTLKGYLAVSGSVKKEEAVRLSRKWVGLDNQDYASRVTCNKVLQCNIEESILPSWGITGSLSPANLKVVAYDFGIKRNILRSLRLSGMAVTLVPANTRASDVLALKPDGVFLSNGPADPAAVTYAIDATRELIGKVPLMGICLGHQILGLALGGRTSRLKFGHHGCNHPVKDLLTGRVEITSQNHNFSLERDSLDSGRIDITHINLNDQTVEGISHRSEPLFSVQYHPEACPGPHDPFYLFDRFRLLIGGTKV